MFRFRMLIEHASLAASSYRERIGLSLIDYNDHLCALKFSSDPRPLHKYCCAGGAGGEEKKRLYFSTPPKTLDSRSVVVKA